MMSSPYQRYITFQLQCFLAKKSEIMKYISFFILLPLVFIFTLPQNEEIYASIFPAVLWSGIFLTHLMSFDVFWVEDSQDGTLEQILSMNLPMEFVAFAKAIIHWLLMTMPLVIVLPILFIFFQFPLQGFFFSCILIFAGSLGLSFLGMVLSSFVVKIENRLILLPLLLIPLYIPTLIMGAQAIHIYMNGGKAIHLLYGLMGINLILCAVSPWLASAAIKQNIAND